jgi:hypothetical protein
MALTFQGNLGGGAYTEYDMDTEPVQVGDRMVPERVTAMFPGEDGAPTIRLELEVRNGVPECRQILIEATPDGREVRHLDLRAIQLETLIARVYSAVTVHRQEAGNGHLWTWKWHAPEEAAKARREMERARAGRPRKLSDERIRKAAEVYRTHLGDRPTEAVAAAFSVAHRTAAKYVMEARARGFLPPTTPGKQQA